MGIFTFLLCVWLIRLRGCLCQCAHIAHQGQKRALEPREPELQKTVRCLVWVPVLLTAEPSISPDPCPFLLKIYLLLWYACVPAWVCMHIYAGARGSQRASDPPDYGVRGSCETHGLGAGSRTCVLCKTSEHSEPQSNLSSPELLLFLYAFQTRLHTPHSLRMSESFISSVSAYDHNKLWVLSINWEVA